MVLALDGQLTHLDTGTELEVTNSTPCREFSDVVLFVGNLRKC